MKVIRGLDNIPELENAVITIGSFDGIHKGHQKLFDRVKSIARQIDGSSVIISFDPHPRQIIYPKDKSLQLITPIDEKLELLEGLDIDYCLLVPFTVEFSQLNPREYIETFLIKKIKPAYIVIGYDHQFGLNREGDFSLLKEYEEDGHFNLVKIEKQEMDDIAISSTKIREAIIHGYTQKANELLGHPFTLHGTVVEGEKIGRTIDYPTANLKLSSDLKIKAKDGIYAAETIIKNQVIPSMLYIGDRPSVKKSGQNERSYEVHLLDFDKNLYDQKVSVRLKKFIRGDEKYDNLEALQSAIQDDEKRIRSFFREQPMIDKPSKVNIAILNYNGSHYLDSYLPLLHDSYRDGQTITVIDNGSGDDSVELVQEWFPEIKLIEHEKNYGFTRGYNVGLTGLKEEYIVLLNSDVAVTDNWLDPIIALMENDPTIGIAQPKIRSLEEKDKFEYAGAAGGYMDLTGFPFCRGRIFDTLEVDEGQYDDTKEVFWASGAAMVIRRSLWENLGGFDESYFAHHEEIDLCWRAKRAGYKVMACGDSQVYHLGGGTLGYDDPRKIYLNFRNNLRTIIKNSSFLRLLWLLPSRAILDLAACLKYLMQGNFAGSAAVIKARWNNFINLGKILKQKSKDAHHIQAVKIGSFRNAGYVQKSIIYAYYLKGIKAFQKLNF